MAVTVTSQLTTIDACDSATPSGWTAQNISGSAGTLAAVQTSDEEQPPFAGTYCYAFDLDIENAGYWKSITSADYSSKIIYIAAAVWTAGNLQVLAPGGGAQSGVYIIARDTSGNYGYWHVAGSDTYAGGWRVFVADLSRAPDTNSGTAPNLANCDGVGIGFNHLAKSKAAHNIFFDLLREADPGDGLKVDTTASSVADLADVVAGDGTELLRSEGGIYFAKAPLIFGDTTSGDMEFSDSGQILVFENLDVPSGHYGITVQGNSGGTINFQMGTKSGTRGISGLQVLGNAPFAFDANDSNIDVLKLYGTAFKNFTTFDLPANASNREVLDCSFVEGGEAFLNTCIVKYCNFINADDGGAGTGAARLSSASHNLSDCSFINCVRALHIDTAGTYSFTNVLWSGGTYHVVNDSGALVTVNALGTSNPSTEENARYSGTLLKAQQYDYNAGAGAYTDESTAAQNTTANDMNLLADIDEVEDAYYFGRQTDKFYSLDVDIGTQGAGTWTVTWEYWNGSTWAALSGVSDGTSGFTAATGWRSVTFTMPGDWATTSVNSITAYWIRARVTAYTSTTTAPKGDQAGLIGDVVINNTVSVKVTCQEADTTKIQSARVLVEADTGGDLPSDDSVSITRSGTTASVSHTAHGLSNGDKVAIRGANQPEYNGVKTISNVTTNAYDYTVSGTPDTPATGTITATAVILDGTTDVNGVIQDTAFDYTNTQPVRGRARKGSSSPYYKTTPITGTITSSGLDATVIMSPDE